MAQFTVAAGTISASMLVPPSALVTVTPDVGAYTVIEYSTDNAAAVANGVATWYRRARGDATAASVYHVSDPAFLRFTPVGGGTSINLDLNPSTSAMSGYHSARSANGSNKILPNGQALMELPEGLALTVIGAAGTVGTLVRTDAAGAVQPAIAIGAGSFTTPAYPGTQKFLISCSAGSVTAEVGAAVLGTSPASKANAKSLKVVLWGDSAVGNSAFSAGLTALGQATQSNGLATATIANHGCYKGEPIIVINCEDAYWYGQHTVSAVVDANTIQFVVDPRSAADLYTTAPSDGIAKPAIVLSHKYGKNNVAIQSMMIAGVIPTDFVNLGGNSQTASAMGWHIDRDLADYPDYDLWICATVGANDIRANGTTGSLKKALDNAKARLLTLKNAGKRVLYLGWQPNDSRDASRNSPAYQADGVTLFSPSTDSVAKATARFHQEMAAWCVEKGIDYLSQYPALVDPTSASGYAVTGATANDLLGDGVHVGKRGARKFGKNVGANWFKAAYPGAPLPIPASLMDRQHDTAGVAVNPASTYIFRNPLMLTVSGIPGLAADVATSGSFGMPAAASVALNQRTIAIDGDDRGNNQRAVFSTTGTGADQAGSVTLTVPAADIKLGGKIRACAHVQFTALASFEGYRFSLSIQTSNYGNIYTEASVSVGSATDVNNFDDTDSINEYPFTAWSYIPADAVITSAAVTVQGFVKATSGAGTAGFTVDVGRLGVESK